MKKIIVCTIIALFWPISLAVSSQDGMGDFSVDLSISSTDLHEWMPSITYNSIDNEFLVLWHTTGVREEGGESMYSIHAQRIAPDGTFLGAPLSLMPGYGPERRILPRAAHNFFTNQYMISFVMGQEITEWDPFITMMVSTGTMLSYPVELSAQPTKANHASIAFNSAQSQYMIVYNDSRNGNADVFGIIINEDGSIFKEDFTVCNAQGEQINAYICYNSSDNTYLVNWEDFRNVSVWQENSDIYGVLLDAEGTIIEDNIAMCDDHDDTANEGDQRHNIIVHNPDKNEFFVAWTDTRPSLDNVGVVGRLIKADGKPAGPDFTVADATGSQIFPHAVYVEKRKQYFVIWDDSRSDMETNWRQAKDRDTYAKWLSDTGKEIGSDFPLHITEGVQRYSDLAYNPLMDRFLIAWRNEVEEAIWGPGGSGHITESGGNVMGTIYGSPSFLTVRVIEEGRGAPVADAQVMIIGLGLLRRETTNLGGWINIAKQDQKTGRYGVITYKQGCQPVFTAIEYNGDPILLTIPIEKK